MNHWNMKVTRVLNRVWRHPNGFLEGCVITQHGIVSVYSQGSDSEVPSTNLQFVWQERLYSVSMKRRYTQRGLATIASRFAQEVVNGQW